MHNIDKENVNTADDVPHIKILEKRKFKQGGEEIQWEQGLAYVPGSTYSPFRFARPHRTTKKAKLPDDVCRPETSKVNECTKAVQLRAESLQLSTKQPATEAAAATAAEPTSLSLSPAQPIQIASTQPGITQQPAVPSTQLEGTLQTACGDELVLNNKAPYLHDISLTHQHLGHLEKLLLHAAQRAEVAGPSTSSGQELGSITLQAKEVCRRLATMQIPAAQAGDLVFAMLRMESSFAREMHQAALMTVQQGMEQVQDGVQGWWVQFQNRRRQQLAAAQTHLQEPGAWAVELVQLVQEARKQLVDRLQDYVAIMEAALVMQQNIKLDAESLGDQLLDQLRQQLQQQLQPPRSPRTAAVNAIQGLMSLAADATDTNTTIF